METLYIGDKVTSLIPTLPKNIGVVVSIVPVGFCQVVWENADMPTVMSVKRLRLAS